MLTSERLPLARDDQHVLGHVWISGRKPVVLVGHGEQQAVSPRQWAAGDQLLDLARRRLLGEKRGERVGIEQDHRSHARRLLGKRFRKTTRAKALTTFVVAQLTGARWSLRLPKLKTGTYTILVRAIDHSGHMSATISKTVQLH